MSKKRLLLSVSTLVGCIIGAGILGIPYVVAKTGLISGLIAVVAVGLFFLLINLYLGEVALRTKGNFYLSYYAEKYLGRTGKRLTLFTLVLGIYGALIAYAFGQGDALASLTGLDSLLCGVIIFALLSWAIYAGIGAISYAEFAIMPLILVIAVFIFVAAVPQIEPSNISSRGITFDGLIGPLGVLLFAFMGTSAIPELKEQLDSDKKLMKKAIILGSAIPIVVYSVFTFAIVGMFGSMTPEVATLGLESKLGRMFFLIGGLFPLLTMSTSFMALGLSLNKVFNLDYGLRKNTSWLLACFVPFLFFIFLKLSKIGGFSSIIDVTGVITGTITICLVVLMAYNAKTMGQRKPEYTVFINKKIVIAIMAAVIVGGLIELFAYF